jgi:hypothetical protein
VSKGVADGYALAKAVWAAGDVAVAQKSLAMNFLLDRDLAHWKTDLARMKVQVGECRASEPINAESAMAGMFTWACEHGSIKGNLLLAPMRKPALQALVFEAIKP